MRVIFVPLVAAFCQLTLMFIQKVKNSKKIILRKSKFGYIDIECGKNFSKKIHRMIIEYQYKRKLTEEEHVHHIDHDRQNNLPENLILVNKH